MNRNLVFLLGGDTFSGAEKRVLLTAVHISHLLNFQTVIFIGPSLYSQISLFNRFKKFNFKNILLKKDPFFKWLTFIKGGNQILRFFSRSRLLILKKPIVHIALFTYSDLIMGMLIRMSGGKVYYEITSPDVAESPITNLLLKYDFLSDGIICVSENTYRICKHNQKSPAVKLHVRQHPYLEDYSDEEISFTDKQNNVVFAHRMMSRKNPLLAVEVFLSLAVNYPDWNFFLCGKGDLADEVSNLVVRSGLKNVQFTGYKKDLRELVKYSKIFVSLIEPDNYPSQSVYEAMGLGCALVLSDTGQSKEKFLHADFPNGFAIEISTRPLYLAIESLILNDSLATLCENSKRHYRDIYSRNLYVQESISFYGLN